MSLLKHALPISSRDEVVCGFLSKKTVGFFDVVAEACVTRLRHRNPGDLPCFLYGRWAEFYGNVFVQRAGGIVDGDGAVEKAVAETFEGGALLQEHAELGIFFQLRGELAVLAK